MTPELPPGYEPFPFGGYETLVGPLYHREQDGRWQFAFRAVAHHINAIGRLHGGMLTTFADHTLSGIVFHHLGRRPCVTVQLVCSFIASAREGEWIEGEGEVIRAVSSTVFARGRVFCGDRELVAVSGVWRVAGEPLPPVKEPQR
jgi:uncharacterized protein (TIGR00369 family)